MYNSEFLARENGDLFNDGYFWNSTK